MNCSCGSEMKIKQEKLIRFFSCPSCKRVLVKDKWLNTDKEIASSKVKEMLLKVKGRK